MDATRITTANDQPNHQERADLTLFPSVEWFESVREIANRDRAFRRLGSCDAKVGVRVGERIYALDFEAFECAAVSEIQEYALADADFVLRMDPESWRSLLTNVKDNGGADSEHTLNTLDVQSGIVQSANPYGLNSFARYHLTLQRFFDVSCHIETEFADAD